MVTLRQLWNRLTADRRRFALICLAIGIGLLLWARLIVISDAPRTAIAEDGETTGADAAVERAPQSDSAAPAQTSPTMRP